MEHNQNSQYQFTSKHESDLYNALEQIRIPLKSKRFDFEELRGENKIHFVSVHINTGLVEYLDK